MFSKKKKKTTKKETKRPDVLDVTMRLNLTDKEMNETLKQYFWERHKALPEFYDITFVYQGNNYNTGEVEYSVSIKVKGTEFFDSFKGLD